MLFLLGRFWNVTSTIEVFNVRYASPVPNASSAISKTECLCDFSIMSPTTLMFGM